LILKQDLKIFNIWSKIKTLTTNMETKERKLTGIDDQ